MSEDVTIKLRDHDAAIVKYRRRAQGLVLPSFGDLADTCDIREISSLRDVQFCCDVYPRMVLVAADSFRGRQLPLRILRSRNPALPIALYASGDEEFAATLLEEEIVDVVVPAETPEALQRAVVMNLLERASRNYAQTERTSLLSQKSVSDSLTGLYNHGHLLEVLDSEFKRAERSQEKLSCVMLDIDHFKAINDSYGHRFGDFILREIADVLRSSVRQTDIIGRYGGEEFMVVLPSTSANGAMRLARKLRASIEEHVFERNYRQTIVTASLGVACNRDPGVVSSEQLLLASDRALYFAKESGRNRVCAAQQHSSLSDFDLHRRPLGASDDQAPVILLLTRSQGLRTRIDDLSELDGFQLICFENRGDFLQEFSALRPSVVVVDIAFSDYGEDFITNLASRTHSTQIPVVAVVDRHRQGPGYDGGASVDDIVMSDFETSELRRRLQNVLKISAFRQEVERLQSELKTVQRRMIKNERLRSIGEMAAGITHEFGNALSAVLGTAESLLLQKGMPDGMGEQLEAIRVAALDGASSVLRLQAFLAPDDARARGVHSLPRLVDESLLLTRAKWKDEALADGRRYTIENRIPAEARVSGDASELREVFVNLITNAIDAMDDGGRLTFEARTAAEGICIVISDTGRGMTAEEVRRVFDPFFTTKADKGTGLGMQLVHSVVERHGGRVEIDSAPGSGTRVLLYLGTSGVVPEVVAPAKGTGACGRPLRILIVDDEKAVREAYGRMLEELGHVVSTAGGGTEGLLQISESRFDMVLTDLSMPDMSGWEVARSVHQMVPEAVIAIMSGWGGGFDPQQLVNCGVSMVLPKPCNCRDLQLAASKVQERLSTTVQPALHASD